MIIGKQNMYTKISLLSLIISAKNSITHCLISISFKAYSYILLLKWVSLHKKKGSPLFHVQMDRHTKTVIVSFSSAKKQKKTKGKKGRREVGMYKKIYRYGISLNWNKIVRDLLYFIQFKWVSSQMYIYFKKRKKYWLNLN